MCWGKKVGELLELLLATIESAGTRREIFSWKLLVTSQNSAGAWALLRSCQYMVSVLVISLSMLQQLDTMTHSEVNKGMVKNTNKNYTHLAIFPKIAYQLFLYWRKSLKIWILIRICTILIPFFMFFFG